MDKNQPKKLYHYTSFDTFVKIWLTKKLKFGETVKVNDICEVSDVVSVDFLSSALLYAYFYIRDSYKQVSLGMDYSDNIKGYMSPMMWGHYGDKRNGVCIEFDFEKLNIPDDCIHKAVKYEESIDLTFEIPEEIQTQRHLKELIRSKIDTVFFTKHNSWQGENEYRVISCEHEYLDITNAITNVYVTKYDSLECELIEKLVGELIPIKYVYYYKTEMKTGIVSKMREDKSKQESYDTNGLGRSIKAGKEHFEKNKFNLDANLILKGI